MDTNHITLMFEAAGVGLTLVSDTPAAACPLCSGRDLVGLPEAA